MSHIGTLFEPDSVGLIGDVEDTKSRSHRILNNLIDYQFSGEIKLVSSETDSVLGYQVHQDLDKVKNSVELLILTVSVPEAIEIVREIGPADNPKVVSIFSSDFQGKEDKAQLQTLRMLNQEKDFEILGPRCTGIFSSHHMLNLTTNSSLPDTQEGKVAFVSQRGSYGDLLFSELEERGYQMGKFVSIGDQVGVSHEDLLKYLQDDPETDVIALLVEDIKNGPEFLQVAGETSLNKPIVAFYVSQDSEDSKFPVYRAAFEQSGVQLFDNTDDFFDALTAFAGCSQQFPVGENLGVVTTSEGIAIAASNEAQKYGLEFQTVETDEEMDSELSSGSSGGTFIQIGNSDQEQLFMDQCEEFVSASQIHGLLLLGIDIENAALVEELIYQANSALKPLLSFVSRSEESEALLKEKGVPRFRSPERAVGGFQVLRKYRDLLSKLKSKTLPDEEVFAKIHRGRKLLEDHDGSSVRTYSLEDTFEYLKENGSFPLAEQIITESKKEAVNFGRTEGLPVMLEVHDEETSGNPEQSYRDIDSLDNLKTAYLSLRRRSNSSPILIRKSEGPGIELMIRAVRDRTFGIIMEFGLGGIFTDVLEDITYRLAPIRRTEAQSMLSSIQSTMLLDGYKQYPPVENDRVEDLLIEVSEFMVEHPEIQMLSLNPIVSSKDRLHIHEAEMKILEEV